MFQKNQVFSLAGKKRIAGNFVFSVEQPEKASLYYD